MAHDVFISYSSKDQKVVEALSHYLESNRIRCFVAYRDIPKGTPWASVIPQAIENSQMMVVVFSNNFNLSQEVDREITICSRKKKPILTYRIENAEFTGTKEYYLSDMNWIDAFPNPENEFGQLTDSIYKLLDIRTRQTKTVLNKDVDSSNSRTQKANTQLMKKSPVRYVANNGKIGFKIDDKVVIEPIYDYAEFFLNDISVVALKCNQGDYMYGTINTEGKVVVPVKYKFLNMLEDGMSIIGLEYNRWGIADKLGQIIIPVKYVSIFTPSEGLVAVQTNDKGGYIDLNNNTILSFIYDSVTPFYNNIAAVEYNGQWMLINKSGGCVKQFTCDSISYFSEGLAAIEIDGMYGYIDCYGNNIIPAIYDEADAFHEGVASVERDGKRYFINTQGEKTISLPYDFNSYFAEGLARVRLNEKTGFINKSGNVIIELKYDGASIFKGGFALVELNRKVGYIDIHGNEYWG